MHQHNKIYFVISGVRDGFRKSHLLSNNNIPEVTDYIDDRRQITNTANDLFYMWQLHYLLIRTTLLKEM